MPLMSLKQEILLRLTLLKAPYERYVSKMQYLEHIIPLSEISFYQKKAAEKIHAEKWEGRNIQQKIENFVNCWVTEEAFKQILIKHGAFFRHRALYVGDAAGAGADFMVKRNGQWITIGIRSIGADSVYRWKSVAYPEDRFMDEQDKISDYVVACYNKRGFVKFFGIVDKETLLHALKHSERRRSGKNQEWFRKVPLALFSLERLEQFLESTGKRQ